MEEKEENGLILIDLEIYLGENMLANIKNYIIAGVVLSTITGLGYLHYTSLLEDVERLKMTNQQLVIANESKDVTINKYAESIQEWKKAQDKYIAEVQQLKEVSVRSQNEVRRLHETFAKHDLSKLASKAPERIEKRINAGTANIFRMLECASGSEDPRCSSSGDKTTK